MVELTSISPEDNIQFFSNEDVQHYHTPQTRVGGRLDMYIIYKATMYLINKLREQQHGSDP